MYFAQRNTAQLTATEIAAVQTIATKTSGGVAAERAENILCFFYDYCLDDAGAPKNNTVKTERPKQTLDEALRDAVQMIVFPNPADFFLEFEYDLLLPSEQNVLRVYDVQGKPIDKIVLGEEPQGIKVLDTRDLSNGVYIYELLKDGEQVKSGKFVIQH